jgi:hypothetical protein
MTIVEQEHLTDSMLIALGLGQLNDEELAGIDDHIAECSACCQVAAGVAPDTVLTLLRSAATETDKIEGNDYVHVPSRTALYAASGSLDPESAPPPALTEHPRYRLGELLGVGGMGAVYKAEHLLMRRPVALKVLNRQLIDKPETVERFGREVRAAARLTHPNIVAAFDAEQAGDVHFLAMEFVEGVSLARHCAEHGPLPVAEACSYARQAALGLQHAHECGMVHRDIKPQNLMLTPGGQVKILDFGLARFIMESAPAGALLPADGASSTDASAAGHAKALTQIGVVVGTPDYIAPEQAQDSHQADIRADIYSLGCMLYDMLAGHAPFPEGNAIQKVKAHVHRTPPSLKTLRRDMPRELVRVVERMMAKDPAQRYQTPADVASALAPFTTAKPPRRRKWPLIAAAFSFLAALALGVVIYVQTDRGTIVIETKDDAVAVLIEKAGGVKIVDKANKREYTLKPGAQSAKPGEYKLDVSESMAGLEFSTTDFELKRGGEVRVTAKLVPAPLGKGAFPNFPRLPSMMERPAVPEKVEPPLKANYSPIDFQALTNQKLKDPLAGNTPGNTLDIPHGEHRFLGIPFQIGEGLLQVGSTKLQDKPAKITGIRVDRKLSSLHFLQATNWVYEKDSPVGSYTIHYADGSSATIPIVYGKDTTTWWKYPNHKTPSAAKVAWKGTNPAASRFGATLWLVMSTWKNPKPDTRVTSIDFASTMDTQCAPFCVAITAEQSAEQTQAPAELTKLWGTPVDPDGDCTFKMDDNARLHIKIPGKLHILTSEVNGVKENSAPRVLREIEGDFQVEVIVSGEFPANTNALLPNRWPFFASGLLVWQDGNNYIRFERARQYMKNTRWVCYPNWQQRRDGLMHDGAADNNELSAEQPVHLRLERKGNTLTASYGDGTNWKTGANQIGFRQEIARGRPRRSEHLWGLRSDLREIYCRRGQG